MKYLIYHFLIFISSFNSEPAKHVYEPERLNIITNYITTTGKVIFIKEEMDGDYHIRLKMDNDIIKLIKKNYTKQDSCIVLEIVCAHESLISKCKCKEYINNIKIPKVGSYITVSGQLVIDKRHNWIEIHPVFDWSLF